MRQRARCRAHFATQLLAYSHICELLLSISGAAGNAAIPPEAVAVSSPAQFQAAVRQGVSHVVINEHLDMTNTPRFSETTILDSGMIAIVPNEQGGYTRSIRGNCTGTPAGLSADPWPPRSPSQCMITVREDFLEAPLQNTQVWISNLYVNLPGVEKHHTTLIGVHGGDIYLTDMTFVADGDKARAVDVKENRRIFIARSYFSRFSKDNDGVLRLEPGARATLSDVTFVKSTVSNAGKPDTVATGPVMGLYDGVFTGGSAAPAAWFHDCIFGVEHSSGASGEVSVEDRNCRVYSNTARPTVWDRNLSREVNAWPLRPVEGTPAAPVNVFADVEGSRAFLRPTDDLFQRIVAQHAQHTGLTAPEVEALPDGTELTTQDPYSETSAEVAGSDAGFWTGRTISLIAGLGSGVLLLVVAAQVMGWWCCFRKKPDDDKVWLHTEEGSKKSANLFSNRATVSPSDAAHVAPPTTSTHWATDVFMTTFVALSGPPPTAAAPIPRKLEYLHAQLSSIGAETVVLERYTLLGPSHRRQGAGFLDMQQLRPPPVQVGHYWQQNPRIHAEGQGVVAFAKGVHDDLGYAFKFFVDRPSFLAERDMYRSKTLGRLLPQVQAEYDPVDTPKALTDSRGNPLPPCIVMERGESLPDWSKRARPDVFNAVAVLAHVATRLRDMHDGGWVHRDIKPENLMLLPRANKWTVIDFGCVARAGEAAVLSYTLVYAAPEVAAAVAAGEHSIVAAPAMDAWALGVVAFELLTGQSAFNFITEGRDSVLGKLLGREELPWEGDLAAKKPGARQRLGLFREPVLSLLRRDPAQRATLTDFCRTVNTVFSSPTTVGPA